MTDEHYLAVETGGTKILARIERADGSVAARLRIATTTPEAAREAIVALVGQALPPGGRLGGAGLAAFGPVILDPGSPDRGQVLATPKPGWPGANLRAALAEALGVAMAVDSDVNAAALAEQSLGAGRGCRSLAYVTVGTGIGGGLAIDGRTLGGFANPEIGHVPVVRAAGDTAPSHCPFHDSCAEGLAAGPAIGARLGPGRKLADDPALMAVIAGYLGQLAATLTLAWSPDRIVWGGGVMTTPGLIDGIGRSMQAALGGYDAGWKSEQPGYCVPAGLEDAGLEGAMLMARGAARAVA